MSFDNMVKVMGSFEKLSMLCHSQASYFLQKGSTLIQKLTLMIMFGGGGCGGAVGARGGGCGGGWVGVGVGEGGGRGGGGGGGVVGVWGGRGEEKR